MHTNETQYYGLPQYVGSDIINPLVDTNTAYQKIDTALHDIAEEAGQGTTDIASLKSKVGNASLDTTAQDLSGAVNELNDELDNASTGIKARLDAVEGDVDTLQGQMVTAQGNITDLQNNKANTSDVNAALALKANQSDVDTALALKANQSAVDDIVDALTAKEVFIDVYHKDVTADGVKTYTELITDLINLINADLAIMPVDEKLMNTAFEVYGIGYFQNSDANYFTTGGQLLAPLGEYSSAFASANAFGVRTIYIVDRTFRIGITDTNAGTSTMTDYTNLVPNEGLTIAFNAQIFKNILS